MAKSNYFSPNTTTQTSDDPEYEVSWVIGEHPAYSSKDLHFLMNTSNGGERNKTWYIHFNNFEYDNTVPNVITGVELILKTRRNGRVYDETICLSNGNNIISDNKTSYVSDGYDHYPTHDHMVYGGEGDLWGGTLLTKAQVIDSAFGVTLRFQGHPYTPHRSGMAVDSVQICFYS